MLSAALQEVRQYGERRHSFDPQNSQGCRSLHPSQIRRAVRGTSCRPAVVVRWRRPRGTHPNSAGTARHSKTIDTTPEDFDAVAAVNLKGAYFLTQTVAKGLIAAGRPGSLINVSSQMAVVVGGLLCNGQKRGLIIQKCLNIESQTWSGG